MLVRAQTSSGGGGSIDLAEFAQAITNGSPVAVDNRGNGATNISPKFENIPYTKNAIYAVVPAYYQNITWNTSNTYNLSAEAANTYVYGVIIVVIDENGNPTTIKSQNTVQNKNFTLSGTTLTTTGANNTYNWGLFVLYHD